MTAALLCLLAVAESLARAVSLQVSLQFLLGLCLLSACTTAPLAIRRPVPAAVVVTAASVLSLGLAVHAETAREPHAALAGAGAPAAFHLLTVAGLCAQLLVLWRLGHSGAQILAAMLAAPFLVLALVAARAPGDPGTDALAIALASLSPAAAWAGAVSRARSGEAERAVAREAVESSQFQHIARGQRARIARELHDVVAHHVSMISVQAETARLAVPGMPPAGARRLSEIGDTARAALTEMRRLLGVLREDTADDPPARQPQPGLAQLNELLDAARDASGSGARLILSGPPAPLDPGVELAAYRIIQEALTNVRRHAPGAAVDVELRYSGDGLEVLVRDNGPGPPPLPRREGHGLLGMRERAAAVGGELRAGAGAGGGFVVAAKLPGRATAGG